MKKLVIAIVFLVCSLYTSNTNEVYICKSKSSKRYHLKKTCRGLKSCKKEIKKIELSKAKRSGRTLCKWED